MIQYLRHALQFIIILALFAAVAAFSNWPPYRQLEPDQAVIMLSFVYGAGRAECRKLTPAEIAKLPPNMRRTQECQRGRRPIHVEFDLNGRNVFDKTLLPTGIAGDGPSKVYERFRVPAGEHTLTVRMRDSDRTEGFDYERTGKVKLASEQMLVIDFQSHNHEFVFR